MQNVRRRALTLQRRPEHSHHSVELTDTLSVASAVQKEVESLGADLEAVLVSVTSRSQSLLRVLRRAVAMGAQQEEESEQQEREQNKARGV